MDQAVYEELTWYDATVSRRPVAAVLDGAVSCDVCVIGGGLAGLTTCLELSRKGKMVVLLEAQTVGSGASGRNGGFVSNGFALGTDDIIAKVGLDDARALHELSRLGTDYVRREIAHSDPGIKMGDGMHVALRHRDGGGFAAYGERMSRQFGEDLIYQDTETTRQQLGSERYFASLAYRKAFHIHPLRYVLHVASAARILGAQIYESCVARQVKPRQNGFEVTTDTGSISCETVVHCVSASDRNIHRPSGKAVLPVNTYIAVTEPLSKAAFASRGAVVDTRRAGNYYRHIDDGRLLWGGGITTLLSRPKNLAQAMGREMRSVYPALQSPRIDYAWQGEMGYAIHKMPLIGRDGSGQWFALAFGGHGLNTTAMAGQVLASAIADGDDTYRRFIPFAPQWAYGQLGRAGVQGAYWWMQLKDKWDEKLA